MLLFLQYCWQNLLTLRYDTVRVLILESWQAHCKVEFVCFICVRINFFFLITSYTGNHNPTVHFNLTHCMCLKLFGTIIHQTLWPLDRHVPVLPCAPISLLSVLQAIKLRQPKSCLLKMPEISQIQTQELMWPHKITKVCTVHNVLRLLGHCPYSSLIPSGMVQPRFPQVQCYFLPLLDSSSLLWLF